MAAARHKRQHDMVADDEIGYALAERGDDARSLMAEHHRRGPRSRTIDHREVGMAKAGRRDLHQDFAAAGTVEIDRDDLERSRGRIGRLRPCRPQHRRPDPHRLPPSSPRSSRDLS